MNKASMGFLLSSLILCLVWCCKSEQEIKAEKMARDAAFRKAASDSNLKDIQRFLREGADLNSADDQGVTALMNGAASGNPDTVHELISRGANVNQVDKSGRIALHFAVNETTRRSHASDDQRTRALKEILNGGANIHAQDNGGKTAFMEAAKWTSPPILEELLKSGADLDSTDSGGMTPLMWAATQMQSAKDTTENVRFLLKAGADIHAKSKTGWTALDYAQKRGNNQAVVEILQNAESENIASDHPQLPNPTQPLNDMDKTIGNLITLGTQAMKEVQKSDEFKQLTGETGKPSVVPAQELNNVQVSCTRDSKQMECLLNNNSRWILQEVLVQFNGTSSGGAKIKKQFTLAPSHPLQSHQSAIIKRKNDIDAGYEGSSYSVVSAFGSKTPMKLFPE